MRNIKLTVAYDGTSYHGFQEQRGTGLPTVQGVLEKCLSELAQRKVQVIGAGRTDAGVHARGQVINFDAGGWNIPTEKIPLAANGILPHDIAALNSREAPGDFHARFSATAKEYRYTIHNCRVPDPFLRRYSLFFPRQLDIGDMRRAAAYLIGEHDFSAFKAAGTPVKSAVRRLYDIRIEPGEIIQLFFRGNGFLYNMVRILVGTLLEVGLKKYPPQTVLEILSSGDRTGAGLTAPPQGLSLMKVWYDNPA
ncbi:MAG: tRNA pseudouridine synthase A [Peptococcaceae bacterium BRH_c4a]|nr:MAG: tRNA pseudouridine synthase A [Peptococcaceae bacterium BRH_c4a]